MTSAWSARRQRAVIGLGLTLVVSACVPSPAQGDKAGAPAAPIHLRLGSPDSEGTPGTAAVKRFADRVSTLSEDRITVQIVWRAADDATDTEGAVIDQVRDGSLDLGWVGSRAWDQEGLTGFSALQAPFLVADYGVLHEFMASNLPGRMLGEFAGIGLAGLGLYPDQLRHPLAFGGAFLKLEDFQGARIRVPSAGVSDDIFKALGAVPVHLNGAAFAEAQDKGEVVGAETSIGNATTFPAESTMTMNLTFYPKLFTLFATSDRLASMTESARETLEAAAHETLAFVLAQDPERDDIQVFCAVGGTLVNADSAEVERIIAAADPVRQALAADPSVAEYISEIQELAAAGTPPPVVVCPS